MSEEEYNEIERLVKLTTADMIDKHSCQDIVRRYINPGEHICMTCGPQVVKMFKKLKTWWSSPNGKDNYTK